MSNTWYPGTGGGGGGGTATGLNFPSAPGNLQINGTTVEQWNTDRKLTLVPITGTANYGQVNHGGGVFDGVSAGKFAGHASGTVLAVNAPSGFGGDLAHLQIAGVSKLKVDSSGNISSNTHNFLTSPGLLQVTGTPVISLTTDRVSIPLSPTSTPNYGIFSVGSGAFDGVAAGHFVGSGSGTITAGNAASGFTGNLVDYQLAGSSKFKVDYQGNLTVPGTITGTVAFSNVNFTAAPGNLQISGTNAMGISLDKITIPGAATGTANYGLLSIGNAPFDGTSAGHYTGVAGGTLIAANAAVTFSGDLINLALAGTSKFKVDNGGNITGASISVASFTAPTLNLSNNPSNIQVTGTTVFTLYTDRVILPTGVTSTANYGTMSIGAAPWDGSSASHYVGVAGGTVLAGNAPSAFAGSLIDFQLAGVSKFKVDYQGNLTVPGTITGTFSQAGVNLSSNPGNIQVTSSTLLTLYTDRMLMPVAITASNAYGQLSLGNGTYDGSSAGHFVGNSQGTALAINPASGYTGDLINAEVAGVSKFKVDASGNIVTAGTITGSFSISGINFTSSPGNLQVTGTTVQTLYTDRTIHPTAVTASPNYGTVSIGSGAWDGVTAGKYVGVAGGTLLALNAPTGYTASLIDSQLAGVSKFKVDYQGNVTAAGTISGTFSLAGINFSASPSNIQVTGTTVETLYTDRSLHTTAPTATANYGTLSIGSGAWDGVTAGKFVGVGTSTLLALNAASGFSGSLIDFQVAGVSKTSLDASGNLTLAGNTIGNGFFGTSVANKANNGPLLDISTTTTTLSQRNNVGSTLFVIKGMAAQTADLQQWQDSTAVTWVRVSAPTYGANLGLLSIGNAPYDGSSASHFVGSANGTMLATNAASGYSGNLIDAQVAGSSKFKVDNAGNLTVSGTLSGTLALSSLNLSANPGNLQVTGTTVQTLYTDRTIFPTIVTGTANYGTVSMGSGTWDGAAGGHFVGVAAGTVLAINPPSGYTGSLIDAQLAGTSKFKVDYQGNVTAAGTITGTFSQAGVNLSSSPGNIQVTGTTVQTLYTDRTIFPTAVTATANYGTVSIGAGAFDGSTAGKFVGVAAGTLLAINAPTGATASLLDIQLAGAARFKVDASGNVTNAGTLVSSGAISGTTITGSGVIGGTNFNLTASPGSIQVTSTAVQTLYTDRTIMPTAVASTANYGTLSIGSGAFDGVTAGKFVGVATGTLLALNAPTGYTSTLSDFQLAGVSKFKVDYQGNITNAGTLTSTGNIAGAAISGTTLTMTGAISGTTITGTGAIAGTTITGSGTVGGPNLNLTSSPGSIQVTGTAVQTLYTDRTIHPTVITGSANYGTLSVGSAPWDGSSAGHFVGSGSGTALAINTASGFAGSLLDVQIAGVVKYKVASTGEVTGTAFTVAFATKTAATYTITTSDAFLLADATSNSVAFTLPAASAVSAGRFFEVKRIDTIAANNVSITAAGADTIDGMTSLSLTNQYQLVGLISDGVSKWYVRDSYA